MSCSKSQIIATIGPASGKVDILKKMVESGLDVARFNFSWSDNEQRLVQIDMIREIEGSLGKKILIIADLPGPRIQNDRNNHTYNNCLDCAITSFDKDMIKFSVEGGLDYIAVSFVSSSFDIEMCRQEIIKNNGKQKIIAKIERQKALENFDEILEASDAIMFARGDLGNEVPIEKIPFIQSEIIKKANLAMKPVIVATQMLTSMVKSPTPTRAEVTDVANAILQGADCVMLSEETSIGKYPVETIQIMEKIVLEAEKHVPGLICKNILTKQNV